MKPLVFSATVASSNSFSQAALEALCLLLIFIYIDFLSLAYNTETLTNVSTNA